jgi:hypothetical protein
MNHRFIAKLRENQRIRVGRAFIPSTGAALSGQTCTAPMWNPNPHVHCAHVDKVIHNHVTSVWSCDLSIALRETPLSITKPFSKTYK